MSDQIKHECGIALIRLMKPLDYYQRKYGTWTYGLQKLYLLMEKQHNRGQDGAGIASIKLSTSPGKPYIFRERSNQREPIRKVFDQVSNEQESAVLGNPAFANDLEWVKENMPFAGELLLGHLRYGTYGKNNINHIHPVLRANNWKSKCLALAGNFNLTNVDEVFEHLISLGQHPSDFSDTVTILENLGHFLDEENERLFREYKDKGHTKEQCSPLIQENIDIAKLLQRSSKRWDGGYVIGGLIGHGDAFVLRDPWGIRPAYYYHDDEIAVVASERPVIQTAFNIGVGKVKELPAGNAFIVKRNGQVIIEQVRETQKISACSFERIYFSRGSDQEIYTERKRLGELVLPKVLEVIDYDLENSVFSFIPNTAETAFYGMIKAAENYLKELQIKELIQKNGSLTESIIRSVIMQRPRIEKIAIKDIKLRTFITQDDARDDLVKHVYDITYGTVRANQDNLIVIDDSIVRGTTLKKSIIKMLDRLSPKRIVIVSSSPQIRYPDCYGIDMSRLDNFIAFRAAIDLLRDRKLHFIINEVYEKCKEQERLPKEKVQNFVKEIYSPFTTEEISDKIAQMLHTGDIKADIKIVYQSIESLNLACPNNLGDWYFTGNYPTPGGNKVVNKAYINFIEQRSERAY